MIEIIEGIPSDDFRRVPLAWQAGKLHIEFASNKPLDVAVLSAAEFKEFETQADAEDEQDWHEAVRELEFEFDFPLPRQKHYLTFWNCNSDRKAFVAYRVTCHNVAKKLDDE